MPGAAASPAAALVVRGAPDAATRDELLRPGRRSIVVACDARRGSPAPVVRRLHLRTVRHGSETLTLGGRDLRVDEDSYLVVDAGVAAVPRLPDPGASCALLLVAFGLDTAGGHGRGGAVTPEFLPTLRPHGDAVSEGLRGIAAPSQRARPEPAGGADDGEPQSALDAQLRALFCAMVEAERRLRQRAAALPGAKPGTRHELLRRVLVAADFIRSHYDQPLRLADVASAACLSSFHLLRLFEQVHGETPHAFLLRKRRAVALRLLTGTRLGLGEIALRAGFGARSSMFRHLRRELGGGGQSIRLRCADESEMRFQLECLPCSTPV